MEAGEGNWLKKYVVDHDRKNDTRKMRERQNYV